MDLDRGMLARIDRRLMAGLDQDETFRMVRVPVTEANWSTWKRYCDAAGISMGRAIMALIERELVSILGESTGEGPPVLAERAGDQLAAREAQLAVRERAVGATEERLRGWNDRLRLWHGELKVLKQRTGVASIRRLGQSKLFRRSAATNDARADQVSSTSIATGWLVASRVAHNAG